MVSVSDAVRYARRLKERHAVSCKNTSLFIYLCFPLKTGGLGGFSGVCEAPLKCITKPPIIGTGICLGKLNEQDKDRAERRCRKFDVYFLL